MAATEPPVPALCSGCGLVAATHPWVGIARDQETGLMTAYPVCQACWADPAHRLFPLAMHFFRSEEADDAVDAAERNPMADHPEGAD